MIFGDIAQGIGNLTNTTNVSKFIIYDANVLTANNTKEQKQYELLTFDGIEKTQYSNNVKIPQQTLENRQFSNDSIIDNPFLIKISAVLSQGITTKDDISADNEAINVNQLEYILKSNTLLVILRIYPLFTSYENIHLVDYFYIQDPNSNALIAHMNFQEIRALYIPNDTITQDQINNNVVPDASLNPTTQTIKDNGTVGSVTPNGNITTLA